MTLTEISYAIKRLANPFIIILGVLNNHFLNEQKLNNLLKNVCNQFRNSKFLDLSGNETMAYQCAKLNVMIDEYDYEDKYLSFNKRLPKDVHIIPTTKVVNKYSKGTIPYYFSVLSKNTSASKPCDKTVPNTIKNTPKKGTIPYYFNNIVKKINDKKTFFRS